MSVFLSCESPVSRFTDAKIFHFLITNRNGCFIIVFIKKETHLKALGVKIHFYTCIKMTPILGTPLLIISKQHGAFHINTSVTTIQDCVLVFDLIFTLGELDVTYCVKKRSLSNR